MSMKVSDVAKKKLGCCEASVYNLICSGELKCFRIGLKKGYRVDPVELEHFIQKRSSDADAT